MGDRYCSGINRQAIIEQVDRVEILAYANDPAQVVAAIEAVAMDPKDNNKLVVGLQFYPPCAHSAEELLACVEGAVNHGISQFSYYNYGIAPKANLNWVKDCIKYCTG